ncbi:unnamed protein product [Allacma fusca]|uniref:Uncharacterized protein n=1 Tax=Allacma fusca TaxID=39272 RepID=A0A8J2K4M7_9HEXA|nr:unnamed protein product [Allacma fusca]
MHPTVSEHELRIHNMMVVTRGGKNLRESHTCFPLLLDAIPLYHFIGLLVYKGEVIQDLQWVGMTDICATQDDITIPQDERVTLKNSAEMNDI